jgi:hypothetical protein
MRRVDKTRAVSTERPGYLWAAADGAKLPYGVLLAVAHFKLCYY